MGRLRMPYVRPSGELRLVATVAFDMPWHCRGFIYTFSDRASQGFSVELCLN